MRIVLFERFYKYLPLLKISPQKKEIIEMIGACPKTPKACFGPHDPSGVEHSQINVHIHILDENLLFLVIQGDFLSFISHKMALLTLLS